MIINTDLANAETGTADQTGRAARSKRVKRTCAPLRRALLGGISASAFALALTLTPAGQANADEVLSGSPPTQTLTITGDPDGPLVFSPGGGTNRDSNVITVLDLSGASDITVQDASGISIDSNQAITVTSGANGPDITATGMNTDGIFAMIGDSNSIGDIVIETSGDVSGGDEGIYARNFGEGAISITSQGVKGAADDGIDAAISSTTSAVKTTSANITVNAQGDVSGETRGIRALNGSRGSISISSQGVTGASGYGVVALIDNDTAVGNISIDAKGDVSGGDIGIRARNEGTGSILITSQGVTGGDQNFNFGIEADLDNNSSVGNIAIKAYGDVSSGGTGIFANHNGTGTVDITVSGHVSGGVYGIFVDNADTSTVTLNAGSRVWTNGTDPSDNAIEFSGGDDVLMITTSSQIGRDTAAGAVSTTGLVDFDWGIDILRLNSTQTAVQSENFGNFRNVERVEVVGGQWDLFGDLSTAGVSHESVEGGSTATFRDKVTNKPFVDVHQNAIVQFDQAGNDLDTIRLEEGSNIILGAPAIADATAPVPTAILTTDYTLVTVKAGSNTAADPETITVFVPSSFTEGTALVVGNSPPITNGQFAALTVNETALVSFEFALENGGSDLTLTASRKSAGEAAAELGVDLDTAQALQRVQDAMTPGGELDVALSTILNIGTPTEQRNAAEQLGVQKDALSASSDVVVQAGEQIRSTISDRLTAMRGGDGFTTVAENAASGFATGDGALSSAVWLRPFFNLADQDDRDGVAGYEADTYGFAFGVDTAATDEARVGIAGAWATSDVEGDGAGQSELDIDSYQITLYGDYDFSGFYAEGFVGYATNSNESSRVINFGGLDRTATADFDSDQVFAAAYAGTSLNLGDGLYLGPEVGLSWTSVSTDSYTETGAGGVSQVVDPDDIDIVVASLRGTLLKEIEQNGGRLIPEVSLGVGYDLVGDSANATARFTGGGAAFNVDGVDPVRFSLDGGVGLTWDTDTWSIGANYDAEIKSDYLSHSGKVEGKLRF